MTKLDSNGLIRCELLFKLHAIAMFFFSITLIQKKIKKKKKKIFFFFFFSITLIQTADSGVASSIPARSHTFVEIDHEIISTVILLPSADSFKKGCCQLQAKVCAQTTG